jgi:hypothetical protein
MTHELINSVIAGHLDRTYLNRSICSRRLYYQRLHVKRLISHHRLLQCLPVNVELESGVSDVG